MANEGLTLVKDLWYTKLTAAASAGATTLTVESTSPNGIALPTPGIVVCGYEQIYYTGTTATTITGCTRGFGDTDAAAHAVGATVGMAPVAAHHNDLVGAIEDLGGSTLAGRNRLINGDARIKQRSSMPTADNSYAIDGMRLLMESASGWTISQETATLPSGGSPAAFMFTVGGTPNAKGGGFWPVVGDDMWDLRGQKASLRCTLRVNDARVGDIRIGVCQFAGTKDAIGGDPVSAWGAAGTNPTLATSWSFANTPANIGPTTAFATYEIEDVAISGGATNLAVLIWCDDKSTTTGDWFIVTDIQLERGPVSTEYDRPNIEQQEVNCLRWFYRYSSEPIGLAYTITILTTDNCQQLPVPMRVTPTVSNASFSVNAGSAGTVSAAATSRRILRFVNGANNWTVNALVSLTADVSAEP